MSDFNPKIVKEFQDGSFAVDCAFCEGSGLFPHTAFNDDSVIETDPCHVCLGKGINIFKVKRDDVIDCRYCGGSGRGWDDNGYFVGEVCKVCNGTGLVVLEPLSKSDTIVLDKLIWDLLHPEIVRVAKSRFDSGHYADSVEAAFKEINTILKVLVKDKIGEELDGSPLMQRAFSLSNPIVTISDLSTESGRNIQKGYLQIFSGAITGIRNPKAHENLIIDRKSAIHFLFLASLLMSKLDE